MVNGAIFNIFCVWVPLWSCFYSARCLKDITPWKCLKPGKLSAPRLQRYSCECECKFWCAPKNSLANFWHQISNKKLRIRRSEGFRWGMRMVLRMKWQIFVHVAETLCEWMFATKFASDCECNDVVHWAGKRWIVKRKCSRTRDMLNMLTC